MWMQPFSLTHIHAWVLFSAPSDSISVPLNVHILTLTLLLLFVLYHPAGLSRSRWELLLRPCQMSLGHIRTGDPVTWILGWISPGSRSRDFPYIRIYRFHRFWDSWMFYTFCCYHVVAFCTSDSYCTSVRPRKKGPPLWFFLRLIFPV